MARRRAPFPLALRRPAVSANPVLATLALVVMSCAAAASARWLPISRSASARHATALSAAILGIPVPRRPACGVPPPLHPEEVALVEVLLDDLVVLAQLNWEVRAVRALAVVALCVRVVLVGVVLPLATAARARDPTI